jgi:ATP-binding cassette subfamily C protein LapB
VFGPDPRMKGLADVECKLTCLVGDEVADWDADAHAEQTAAEQRKDVA